MYSNNILIAIAFIQYRKRWTCCSNLSTALSFISNRQKWEEKNKLIRKAHWLFRAEGSIQRCQNTQWELESKEPRISTSDRDTADFCSALLFIVYCLCDVLLFYDAVHSVLLKLTF